MKVLIAEKPSVARQIAAHVGADARRDGYLEGNGYQITWALGHLVTLADPHEYDLALKRWTLESLPIVPTQFRLVQTGDSGARKQFKTIRDLLSAASEIICATDAGREGELIFRYIMQKAQGARVRSLSKKMTRVWLSSLTEPAIESALKKRRPLSDYDNLYEAARCRSESDWIVGMNATRNYSVRYGQGGILWSVGRVQTPVLALLARRDDAILHFKPIPWFEVNTRYRNVIFKRRAGRFSELNEAETFLKSLRGEALCISKISSKKERQLPPQLFDLTSLQRSMNARFGISAAETLKHAQSLYESQVITYPRTDSRYLTTDMKGDVRASLQKLRSSRALEIDRLDLDNLSQSRRIFDDSRVNDHHAIIATGKPMNVGETRSPKARILEAIVTRMIAAFYPPCLNELTIVDALVDGHQYGARGKVVVDAGWTVLYPQKKKKSPSREVEGEVTADEQDLPRFTRGESGPQKPYLHEGITKPPKHHTENSLLGMMETAGKLVDDENLKEALKERGLGTPATRAAIIETLLRRGYIVRKGKELHVTDLGIYLVCLIQDPILKSAEMTGDWEEKLKQVERGSLSSEAFMQQVASFTRTVIEGSARNTTHSSQLGSCPLCAAPIMEGQRGYGCQRWKEGCPFVLWKEYRGHQINRDEATQLLSHQLVVEPVTLENEGPQILYLGEKGDLSHIAPPNGSRQQNAKRTDHAAGRNRTNKRLMPSKKAGMRNTKEPLSKARSSAQLFQCPACDGAVLEQAKSYACNNWQSGCSFVIWKTVAGKKISSSMARQLASGKTSRLLKGFKSKVGKKFDARLKYNAGKVSFVFEN